MKISCIIPAYNEEKSILQTVQLLIPLLDIELYEVIIINDNSTDATKEKLSQLPILDHLHIVNNPQNLWKSGSVAQGIKKSKGDYIFLLDADLLNLNAQNIIDLIAPVKNKKSWSSIAFIKNSRPLRPFRKIDYCNGQRVLPTTLLKNNLSTISELRSYGLEVFLNKLQIQHQLSLASIHRNNVENDFHQNKDGRISWRKRNLKIWRDIIRSAGGIFAIYKMNYDLQKLLVNREKTD